MVLRNVTIVVKISNELARRNIRDMYVYIPGLSNGANGSSGGGERLHRERLVIRRTIKQAQKRRIIKIQK